MGALMRATAFEADELFAGDEHWWPDLCASVAEVGPLEAVRVERERRGWAGNALMAWIRADAKRYSEFDAAVKDHADVIGWETKAIADGATDKDVAARRLQVETRFKLAGKVHRAAWGDKVTVEQAVNPGDRELLEGATELLRLFRERDVTPQIPEIAVQALTVQDEI